MQLHKTLLWLVVVLLSTGSPMASRYNVAAPSVAPLNEEGLLAELEQKSTWMAQLEFLIHKRRSIQDMAQIKMFNRLIARLIATGDFRTYHYDISYPVLTVVDKIQILNAMIESYMYQATEEDYVSLLKKSHLDAEYLNLIKEALKISIAFSDKVGAPCWFYRWSKPSMNLEGIVTGSPGDERFIDAVDDNKLLQKWKEILESHKFSQGFIEALDAFYSKVAPHQRLIAKAFNSLESYAGKKLLLFGGHHNISKDPGAQRVYAAESRDWYTVNLMPQFNPDLLADIKADETLDYLRADKKFALVVNENGDLNAFEKAGQIAAEVLESGGIYYCGIYPLLKKLNTPDAIEKWAKSVGFSSIIFFNDSSLVRGQDGSFWFKKDDVDNLIRTAEGLQGRDKKAFIAIK